MFSDDIHFIPDWEEEAGNLAWLLVSLKALNVVSNALNYLSLRSWSSQWIKMNSEQQS